MYFLPALSLIINQKKKEIQNFLQAFTINFNWISFSYVIYRTSTDYAQID